jgi:hypothetical protein
MGKCSARFSSFPLSLQDSIDDFLLSLCQSSSSLDLLAPWDVVKILYGLALLERSWKEMDRRGKKHNDLTFSLNKMITKVAPKFQPKDALLTMFSMALLSFDYPLPPLPSSSSSSNKSGGGSSIINLESLRQETGISADEETAELEAALQSTGVTPVIKKSPHYQYLKEIFQSLSQIKIPNENLVYYLLFQIIAERIVKAEEGEEKVRESIANLLLQGEVSSSVSDAEKAKKLNLSKIDLLLKDFESSVVWEKPGRLSLFKAMMVDLLNSINKLKK